MSQKDKTAYNDYKIKIYLLFLIISSVFVVFLGGQWRCETSVLLKNRTKCRKPIENGSYLKS